MKCVLCKAEVEEDDMCKHCQEKYGKYKEKNICRKFKKDIDK
jgi:hypothetical protein